MVCIAGELVKPTARAIKCDRRLSCEKKPAVREQRKRSSQAWRRGVRDVRPVGGY